MALCMLTRVKTLFNGTFVEMVLVDVGVQETSRCVQFFHELHKENRKAFSKTYFVKEHAAFANIICRLGNLRKQDASRTNANQSHKRDLKSSLRIDLSRRSIFVDGISPRWNSESAKITDHPRKRNRMSFPKVDFGRNSSYRRY